MSAENSRPRFEILKFPHFSDERGTLTPFEFDDGFPFEVQRVYFVTGAEGAVRGAHAHLIEQELFVAISGSLTALVNDGSGDQEIILDQPNKALLVRTGCWHEFQNFSPDAVMACFSSTHHMPGEENYVTDKEEFLRKFRA